MSTSHDVSVHVETVATVPTALCVARSLFHTASEHGHESKCPDSLSPHRIRTGAISHMREAGMGVSTVAERVDATAETIRDHYDRADEHQLMENRRNEVQKLAF